MGTHTYKYFIAMGKAFNGAKTKAQVLKALDNLKTRILRGDFL
jgi:hypothetical protein